MEFYAQVFGVSSPGYYAGIDVAATTPDPSGISSGNGIAGPVGVTNFGGTFIESGPEKSCGIVCDIHPYWAWNTPGSGYHTNWASGTALSPGGRYGYKSIHIGSNQWQAQYCGSGCGGLVTANLGLSYNTFVTAGGETSSSSTHFGDITDSAALLLPSGGSWSAWCHNPTYDNYKNAPGGTISACSANSWVVHY